MTIPGVTIHLSKRELSGIIAAVDTMLDSLPIADNVPDVERDDARTDRLSYENIRHRLERQLR